jgi:UDP-glucose 4-epimerase
LNVRRALVTGGAGFIGSHLVDRLLAAGSARVVVVDNFFLGKRENLEEAVAAGGDRLRIVNDDATDLPAMREIVERERIEDVYNLATKPLEYSFDNPAGAFDVNTRLAVTWGELLRKGHYARLVHTSSSEVFGSAKTRPMREDHPRNPTTPYAAGKAAADLLLLSYVRTFDLDIRILRPFNNYGPRQNWGLYSGVVPKTAQRLLEGLPPIVHGDGKQGRDFVYVEDVADALLRAAAEPKARGGEFNIASGEETPIHDVLAALCEAAHFRGEWVREPRRAADVDHHIGDGARLRDVVGYRPTTELRQGLARTFSWYATRLSRTNA